jgi:hypothetical protein
MRRISSCSSNDQEHDAEQFEKKSDDVSAVIGTMVVEDNSTYRSTYSIMVILFMAADLFVRCCQTSEDILQSVSDGRGLLRLCVQHVFLIHLVVVYWHEVHEYVRLE